ncbi:MAG TPA: glycosyltransferase family 2 protein [Verrucomicrobiae bacterium]|nr:glycosyltransferase family 2 protein [Verrucomicrobiae bacterium]
MTSPGENNPLVSIISVNYNGKKWLERFFASVREQTIFDRIELILVDNSSTDGSAEICQKELATWRNGTFLPTGGNFGFGGGNNRGAAVARGKYFLFVNPDVWFEPDCLAKLFEGTEKAGTGLGCALLMDYDSNTVQARGASGFDIFGCMTAVGLDKAMPQPFAVATFFFIHRDAFQKLGGFDEEFFLYNEEMDLSWRAWIAGYAVTTVESARMHHQGVSSGDRTAENRTNETKRFYANRNQILALLKNSHGPLLLLVLTQILLISVEAVVGALLARQLSFMRWSLLKPVGGCWRLRKYVLAERRRIAEFRKRGDFWMICRFFSFRFGRWMDVKRLFSLGVKIDKAR